MNRTSDEPVLVSKLYGRAVMVWLNENNEIEVSMPGNSGWLTLDQALEATAKLRAIADAIDSVNRAARGDVQNGCC